MINTRNPRALLARQAGGIGMDYSVGLYSPVGDFDPPTKYIGNNPCGKDGRWNIHQRAFIQYGNPEWSTPTSNQLVRFVEPQTWSPRVIPQEHFRQNRSSPQLEQRLTGYFAGRGGSFYITPGREFNVAPVYRNPERWTDFDRRNR